MKEMTRTSYEYEIDSYLEVVTKKKLSQNIYKNITSPS